MTSARRGTTTSEPEVLEVTEHGFRLRVEGRVHVVGFDAFPWFRGASAAELARVVVEAPGHLRWPDLDVDLAVESLDHPERYPLVSRDRPAGSGAGRPRGK